MDSCCCWGGSKWLFQVPISLPMACAVCGGASLYSTERLADWQSSPRVKYHVSRFTSKNAERVLQRYSDSLPEVPDSQLQRYATHVAAWVAVPKCGAARLSAVELLACYLQQIKARGASCCPCLLTGLKMIWQTAWFDGPCDGPWARLQEAMPAEVLSTAPSCGSADILRQRKEVAFLMPRPGKSVRLLQKSVQNWRNKAVGERDSFVESLEAELEQLHDSDNDARLRFLLRRAAAALSPPRFQGSTEREELEQDQQDAVGGLLAARKKLDTMRLVTSWCDLRKFRPWNKHSCWHFARLQTL